MRLNPHRPPAATIKRIARSMLLGLSALLALAGAVPVRGQTPFPEMLAPGLQVRAAASNLSQPIQLAFLGADDFLVLEKNTGIVRRVVAGASHSIALDLAVNSASERGLLGIALHPAFPANPGVYLYWTESSTGADTNVVGSTTLLGNRVDRFLWNGASLVYDRNILRVRALQSDAGQSPAGNHNGGVLTFGLDGKLLIFIGDVGRRGQMQNLPCGPTSTCPGSTVADDQYGGPHPDNAHLSGVILRLNDDGSTPTDNPFYSAGAAIGGEAGANIQRIYSYGHRNGFGMAVDPRTGRLWMQENGDDSFSELNRIVPGMNGGWIQVAGPAARVAEFRQIETTFGGQSLQQQRWPPTNIATNSQNALARLYMLPGAQYRDPDLSWKWEVAPGGLGFVDGTTLGAGYAGDLFMGAATPNLAGGYLFRFKLTIDRQSVAVDDARLADRVADNLAKHDITESESLLVGRNFGVVTDIRTGPNGNLFVVSLTHGRIYEIWGTGMYNLPIVLVPAR